MSDFKYVTDPGLCPEACGEDLVAPESENQWARCKDHDSWWTVISHPDTGVLSWEQSNNPPARVVFLGG